MTGAFQARGNLDQRLRRQAAVDLAGLAHAEPCASLWTPPRCSPPVMAGRAANGLSTINHDADGGWHGHASVGFTSADKPDRRHSAGKTHAVAVPGCVGRSASATPASSALSPHHPSPTGSNTCSPQPPRARCCSAHWRALSPPPQAAGPSNPRHRLVRVRPEHLDQLYTALLDDGYSPGHCATPDPVQDHAAHANSACR